MTSLAPDSSTANWAALRSETPTALGLPPCVSGRITPMRTGPVPRVSPTVAAPLKGWLCTGVVGAAIDLSKLGSPVGPQAARAIAAQPTKASAAGLAAKTPEVGR